MVGEKQVVTMRKDSDKKHSVLFKTEPESMKGPGDILVLDSAYIKRPFSTDAKRVRVTIEVIE